MADFIIVVSATLTAWALLLSIAMSGPRLSNSKSNVSLAPHPCLKQAFVIRVLLSGQGLLFRRDAIWE